MLFKPFFKKITKAKINLKVNTSQKELLRLATLLFLFILLHTGCMVYFEHLSFYEAFWLTLTTATTVGYGDHSASTLGGRLSTIILMYLAGIAVLAQVAALYFELRQEVKTKKIKGQWKWNMKGHIVFINAPKNQPQIYFTRLIHELRKSHLPLGHLPIIIVSPQLKEGLDPELIDLNTVLVNKPCHDPLIFERANLIQAKVIIILAQTPTDPSCDATTFDLIDRLKSQGCQSRFIVETVLDSNKKRFIKAGVENVVRPLRAYPELISRTILTSGSERVIEDIFDSTGEEFVRYDLTIKGIWKHVINTLVENEVGIPLAYMNLQGEVISHHPLNQPIHAQAIFVIIREQNTIGLKHVQALLKQFQ